MNDTCVITAEALEAITNSLHALDTCIDRSFACICDSRALVERAHERIVHGVSRAGSEASSVAVQAGVMK